MSVGLRTLVLNRNYMPISLWPLKTIPAEDAIGQVLNNKAQVIYNYPRKILTPSRTDLFWPSVIVDIGYRVDRVRIGLNRDSLYYRDHGLCYSCGKPTSLKGYTFEHIIPRSKGGTRKWTNLAVACKPCNALKGNSMPVGRWKPKFIPFIPTYAQLFEARKKFPIEISDPRWEEFLPKWQHEVKVILHESMEIRNFECVAV